MLKEKVAALYTRVSTREQAETGYSIEEQENQLKEYCNKHGIIVGGLYTDRGISGKNMMKRPGVMALMVDAEKEKFNMVIVWKLNRISRNQKDSLSIIEKFSEYNIQFVSITENLETLTAMGKLHFSIMSGFAEFERNQIAENVVMGMNARAREGRWNGGIILGYDLVQNPQSLNPDDRILAINEHESSLVRHIFDLYSKGNGYKSIANQINHEGYKTKKGNSFGIVGVRGILMNPTYCGYIRYGLRKDWATKRRKGINPNPILVEGIHSPIITKELYERVQELMNSKGGKPKRTYNGSFPLTGILRCPECGAGMVSARVVSKRKDGSKNVNRYYNCGIFKVKGSAVCHANGVRADAVESEVFRKLKKVMTSEPFLKALVVKVNQNRRKKVIPAEKKLVHLQKEVEKCKKNRETYFKLIESGKLDTEILVCKFKEIAEKIEMLESEILTEKANINVGEVMEVPFELVKSTMDEFEKLMDNMKSNEEKKTLLHLLIDEIKIGPDKSMESLVIKFNKTVVDFAFNNGGLPDVGNPLSIYATQLHFGAFDFKISI